MNRLFRYLSMLIRKPILASAAVVTGSISSAAFIDYNREIIEVPTFTPRHTCRTGESMVNLHDVSSQNMLTFEVLLRKKDDTIESSSLYASALNAKADIVKDGDVSETEAEDTVIRTYKSFAMRMARRSLIRNGNYVKWVRALVEDYFIKVVTMPTVTFIAMKLENY